MRAYQITISTDKTYAKAIKGRIVPGGKALVVDDENEWIKCISTALKKTELFTEILTAPDLESAMRLFKKNAKEITFISTDMNFPKYPGELAGFEQRLMGKTMVTRIRKSGFAGPVIVVSSSPIEFDGVEQYIVKGVLRLQPEVFADSLAVLAEKGK